MHLVGEVVEVNVDSMLTLKFMPCDDYSLIIDDYPSNSWWSWCDDDQNLHMWW